MLFIHFLCKVKISRGGKLKEFKKIIEQIKELNSILFQSDFLLTWERSIDELKMVLLVAEALRCLRENNISIRCFDSGLAISHFKDKSTRTRFAFASAANSLGLALQDIDESTTQIAHSETVRETSNMISFFAEVIGIRDDIYLNLGHNYMKEVSEAVEDGFREGVLLRRPGVINLQSDLDHPSQTLSDLLYLKKHYGTLENLRGKKIAVTWAYSPSYGKPLSVPQGLITLMTRFGMDVTLAYPKGYNLVPETIKIAEKNAIKSEGKFYIEDSIEHAFKEADIVYPKSWAPYNVMRKRTELLKSRDFKELEILEQRCLKENMKYRDWECDEEKMRLTRNNNALYMHCLPADISSVSCENGEVSKEVFEKHRISTYLEAENKPYIIASMILNSAFKDPARVLEKIIKRNTKQLIES